MDVLEGCPAYTAYLAHQNAELQGLNLGRCLRLQEQVLPVAVAPEQVNHVRARTRNTGQKVRELRIEVSWNKNPTPNTQLN